MIPVLFKGVNTITLISLFFLVSSYQTQPNRYRIKTLKQISPDTLHTNFEFKYDNLGRLTLIKDNSSHNYQYTTYTYYNDMIILRDTSGDAKPATTCFILDAKGYAVSEPGVNYKYDDNGYLKKKDFTEQSTVLVYTILNGDIMSEKSYVKDTLEYEVDYTYYPTVDLVDNGLRFMGENSIHLRKSRIEIENGQTESIENYTYIFDKQGRVDTKTFTDKYGSYTFSYTYY